MLDGWSSGSIFNIAWRCILAQDISTLIDSVVLCDDIDLCKKIRKYGAVLKLSGRSGSCFANLKTVL